MDFDFHLCHLVRLSPRSRGEGPGSGCILVISVGALGRVWVWMMCCIYLASNPALVAYEIVLLVPAYYFLFLLPLFFFLLLFYYIRCYSWAISRYPVDYLVGEIQLTNYAFSHDMICQNLDPSLVSLFLLSTFRVVRRICWLSWVGPQKVAGKAS